MFENESKAEAILLLRHWLAVVDAPAGDRHEALARGVCAAGYESLPSVTQHTILSFLCFLIT